MRINFVFTFLVSAFLVSFVGCGEKLPYPVVDVWGTITYQGKPLPKGLMLQFIPADGEGRPSVAAVGDEGKFKAIYTRQTNGIQVGKMTLKVGWGGSDDGSPPPKEIGEIVAKYGGDSAGFPVEIAKADKEFKIDLK